MHSCFELVIIGYPSDTDTVLGPSPQDINFQANSRHLMLLNKYQYLLSRNSPSNLEGRFVHKKLKYSMLNILE